MVESLTLGQRVALLRRLRGWTQMDLAIALQTDKTYVSRLETGSVKTIKSDSLIKLTQLFKVSADYILGLTNDLPLEDEQTRVQLEAQMEHIRR